MVAIGTPTIRPLWPVGEGEAEGTELESEGELSLESSQAETPKLNSSFELKPN